MLPNSVFLHLNYIISLCIEQSKLQRRETGFCAYITHDYCLAVTPVVFGTEHSLTWDPEDTKRNLEDIHSNMGKIPRGLAMDFHVHPTGKESGGCLPSWHDFLGGLYQTKIWKSWHVRMCPHSAFFPPRMVIGNFDGVMSGYHFSGDRRNIDSNVKILESFMDEIPDISGIPLKEGIRYDGSITTSSSMLFMELAFPSFRSMAINKIANQDSCRMPTEKARRNFLNRLFKPLPLRDRIIVL